MEELETPDLLLISLAAQGRSAGEGGGVGLPRAGDWSAPRGCSVVQGCGQRLPQEECRTSEETLKAQV